MDNDKHNRMGMSVFLTAFAVAIVFFIFVIFKNPGEIDRKVGNIAKGISHKDIEAREKAWRNSSAELIATGKELYAVNCTYCHSQGSADLIVDRYSRGEFKYGSKETDIYRVIFRGIPGATTTTPIMPRMDFISSPNRWALVHYLRSIAKNSATSSGSDWDAFDAEKIW